MPDSTREIDPSSSATLSTAASPPWRLCIDTGGTFTDCLAIDPEGREHRTKVLSSSSLRATVAAVVSDRSFLIRAAWSAPTGLLCDFDIIDLGRGEITSKVIAQTISAVADVAEDAVDQGDDNNLVRNAASVASVHLVETDRPHRLADGTAVAFRSDEEAPVLAARLVTRTPRRDALPPIDMRLATTRATNVLLECKGARVALFITRGFGDLLRIGDQTRPDLFALDIRKPRPLFATVVEVDERLDASGVVVRALDEDSLRDSANRIRSRPRRGGEVDGIDAAAVVFMHAWVNDEHERRAAEILSEAGFSGVSRSADLAPLIRIVPRGATAVADAYVAPVIREYARRVSESLATGLDLAAAGRVDLMSSAGGLVPAAEMRAKDCLLSGPAGGVVGAARIAEICLQPRCGDAQTRRSERAPRAIGFDMGGTSTDVCRYDGEFQYRWEQQVGSARILSPAFAIETVASGGGSICGWRHGRFEVGPQSAAAEPGPACYGQGGPLTITDVNLLLGRLNPERFNLPLDVDAARRAFERVLSEDESRSAPAADDDPTADHCTILDGFLRLADERMADAIAQISIRQGVDPREYALVSFGGAGGQHACRVADHLGIGTIIMPRDASILSAFGLHHARFEHIVERQVLRTIDECGEAFDGFIESMRSEAVVGLQSRRQDLADITAERVIISARLRGQDATIALEVDRAADVEKAFAARYEDIYGHEPDSTPIEIESIRVIASSAPEPIDEFPTSIADTFTPVPSGTQRCWSGGAWREVATFELENLEPGAEFHGPAIVFADTSTFIVEYEWRCSVHESGALILTARREVDSTRRSSDASSEPSMRDPMQRDLFTHRFTAIAREMGEILERTARSTNVKERRDFSCALLDADGRLLVHAPHMPVHLGALGMCVRAVREVMDFEPGDVVLTNHPAYGGSHLPDLTLITPVFAGAGDELLGYVANRAHHAEIGGTRPGSMPPRATCLAEEGVVIAPMHLVRRGGARFDEVERLLRNGPHPSRAVADNLADLRAALAANRHGARALQDLAERYGAEVIRTQMEAIRCHASIQMRRVIEGGLGAGRGDGSKSLLTAEDVMDDGWWIAVAIARREDRLIFDFEGTSPVHPGNLNATPAIVHSAIMYVLRVMLGEAMPLNEGIMACVDVRLPRCFLNPTFGDDPVEAPAVVGGNVETSQRIVDVLLRAFNLAAASQGTMNNTLFGTGPSAYGSQRSEEPLPNLLQYYETVCGGAGATSRSPGADAVHTHMTNTRLTDPEILELRYPVRIERFAIREGSGGVGVHRGGDGVVRELRFLQPVSLSLLTQRRTTRPFGLAGGGEGDSGRQQIVRVDGTVHELSSIDGCEINAGDRFVMETPGGGGWGDAASESSEVL